MARDHYVGGGELNIKVKKWMNSNFEGKFASVRRLDSGFSIIIKKDAREVNIVDEGVGFSQCLPMVVDRFNSNGKNGVEIVEQPELHLHPSACGAMMDLYLTAVSEPVTVLLETHSKEMVLRLRRRIAESDDESLKDNFSIIYMDRKEGCSLIDEINIDENGAVDWWPDGVFEESFEETIAIRKASYDS